MRVRVVGAAGGRIEALVGFGMAVLAIAVGVRTLADVPPLAVVALALVAVALLLLSAVTVLIGRWALRSPFLGWPVVKLAGAATHWIWARWVVVGVEVEGKRHALVRVDGNADPNPTCRDRVVEDLGTHVRVVTRRHRLRSERR